MKKLSLNKTWEECLRMWRDIITMIDILEECGEGASVGVLKYIWMELNYPNKCFKNDCFFCEYADEVGSPQLKGGCWNCPGTKIDPNFACELVGRKWWTNPYEFLEWLEELNKKRLARKKK